MTPNPYLSTFSSDDVDKLVRVGRITPDIDGNGNLLILMGATTIASSSITIPLQSWSFDPLKVETKYTVEVKELA